MWKGQSRLVAISGPGCTTAAFLPQSSSCSCSCWESKHHSRTSDEGNHSSSCSGCVGQSPCDLCGCASASSRATSDRSTSFSGSSCSCCPACRDELNRRGWGGDGVPQLLYLPLAPPYADGFEQSNASASALGPPQAPPQLAGLVVAAPNHCGAASGLRDDEAAAVLGGSSACVAPAAGTPGAAIRTTTVDDCTQTEFPKLGSGESQLLDAAPLRRAPVMDRDVQVAPPLPPAQVSVAVSTDGPQLVQAVAQTDWPQDHDALGVGTSSLSNVVGTSDAGVMSTPTAVADVGSCAVMGDALVPASTISVGLGNEAPPQLLVAPLSVAVCPPLVVVAEVDGTCGDEAVRRQHLEAEATDGIAVFWTLWCLSRAIAHQHCADALRTTDRVHLCPAEEGQVRAAVEAAEHDAWHLDVVVPFFKTMVAVVIRSSQSTVANMEVALSRATSDALRAAEVTVSRPQADAHAARPSSHGSPGAVYGARVRQVVERATATPSAMGTAAADGEEHEMQVGEDKKEEPALLIDASCGATPYHLAVAQQTSDDAAARTSRPTVDQGTTTAIEEDVLTRRGRLSTTMPPSSVNRGLEPRPILQHVDLFLPVHERFARAGEIAAAAARGAPQRAA